MVMTMGVGEFAVAVFGVVIDDDGDEMMNLGQEEGSVREDDYDGDGDGARRGL